MDVKVIPLGQRLFFTPCAAQMTPGRLRRHLPTAWLSGAYSLPPGALSSSRHVYAGFLVTHARQPGHLGLFSLACRLQPAACS